jgi:hypothetical protein
MKITVSLLYATNQREELTDIYTLLYSIMVYDVIEISVEMGVLKKTFKLSKSI